MINNILRGFIYFVVLVLVQVLILNNIHFLRVATPFFVSLFHTENASGELTDECGVFLFSDRVDD